MRNLNTWVYFYVFETPDVVELFFRILRFRCTPTVCSLNLLLSLLCRKRECLKMVPDILLKSRGLKIRLEESSFWVLIKSLCRIMRVDYAIKMMNCMVEEWIRRITWERKKEENEVRGILVFSHVTSANQWCDTD